jgi:hypothetical protein
MIRVRIGSRQFHSLPLIASDSAERKLNAGFYEIQIEFRQAAFGDLQWKDLKSSR